MSDAQDHARLTDEAIDLVIRAHNAPDSPVAASLAQEWRARSVEHERIWSRVMRVHGAVGKVLSDPAAGRSSSAARMSRRSFMVAGMIGVGVLLGAGYLANTGAPADVYATAKGETRSVALADGSTAMLGPQSTLEVRLGQDTRALKLVAGSVYVEVARDESRPLSVRSGEVVATALGTGFDVSADAGFVTVAVSHGVVAVNGGGVSGTRLEAGDWVRVDGASAERGRVDPAQVAAWRDKYIVADRETVAALAARIGRWLPDDVTVEDAAIGAQRVSGLFDLTDPMRALEAAVHPAGGVIRREASGLVVTRP